MLFCRNTGCEEGRRVELQLTRFALLVAMLGFVRRLSHVRLQGAELSAVVSSVPKPMDLLMLTGEKKKVE